MKKTSLLMMALCIGAITSFTACSGVDTKEENTTDSATIDNNAVPPPSMDTTHSMMDTSMTDTTKKTPQ